MKTRNWIGAAAAAGMMWGGTVQAGDLTPPGAPASTMHTLEEIYQELQATRLRLREVENRLERANIGDPPVSFQWVTVGDPGNEGLLNLNAREEYGAVAQEFRISAFEVTNGQYMEFLNAVDPSGVNPNGIYNSGMASDVRGGISLNSGAAPGAKYAVKTNMGNKPVNFVSFFDAMRFVNWLENGQGSGGTESGTYTIGNGLNEVRSSGATYFLPTDNEWFKAAFYDPADPAADAGGTTNYWSYPTQSDTEPIEAMADAVGNVTNAGPNVANYDSGDAWSGAVTTVGSCSSTSHYGAFDMGGNVEEWCEKAYSSTEERVAAGSSSQGPAWLMSAEVAILYVTYPPSFETEDVGFRVARTP